MSDDPPPTVGELVEYCRIQAGLLSGRAETIGDEADELLDEIDADIGELRAHLADHAGDGTAGPTERPDRTEGAGGPEVPTDADVSDLEEREAELEEKQAVVDAKRARMTAFQDLAAAYTDLAESIRTDVDDWETALERVVDFESDRDAPAYFDERVTICETVAEASGEDDG